MASALSAQSAVGGVCVALRHLALSCSVRISLRCSPPRERGCRTTVPQSACCHRAAVTAAQPGTTLDNPANPAAHPARSRCIRPLRSVPPRATRGPSHPHTRNKRPANKKAGFSNLPFRVCDRMLSSICGRRGMPPAGRGEPAPLRGWLCGELSGNPVP